MTLHVVIARPLGRDGCGGIDQVMDGLCKEVLCINGNDIVLHDLVTRGRVTRSLAGLVFLWAMLKLVALRALNRCDVLHLNVARRGSTVRKAALSLVARVMGFPTVVHLHGSGYDEYWPNASSFTRALAKGMFLRASKVVVLGGAWKEFVCSNRLAQEDTVEIVMNGSKVWSFLRKDFEARPVEIVFLGQHGPRKGVLDLVAALASLRDLGGWHATLAGDGATNETRSALRAAKIDDRVTVPGWLNRSETDVVLEQSQILVLPSYAENLPMSVIEGMAARCAVVATPVGAVIEIISNGQSGILVRPGDVSGLAGALRKLITDEHLRLRLGTEAQLFHSRYLSITRQAERLLTIWLHVYEASNQRDATGR